MSPLLWALLACPAPTKPDTEPESCYSSEPSAAGGCPVFEDCATADLEEWAVVDVCGDGLDNDCDGVVDDSRCVDGCVMGDQTTTLDLGSRLAVASNDPGFWAVTATDPTQGDDRLLSYVRKADTFQVGWSWDWNEGGLHSVSLAMTVALDQRYFVTSVGEVVNVDDNGAAQILADLGAPASWGGNAEGVDMYPSEGQIGALAGRSAVGEALRTAGITEGAFSDNASVDARYLSSGVLEESFGEYVLFLPDPGGDGIPEVVIGAPGTLDHWDSSALYIFDGADTGTLTPADAVAAFTDDRPYYVGEDVQRAGDLNGDGYEELISSGDVLFGPFEGTIAVAHFGDQASATRATSGASVNEDELPDLVIQRPGADYTVEVYLGPFEPAHYDEADADWIIDTTGRQYLLAQVDDDPEAELISADYNFGPTGDEGIVTFIDFACR